jgi:hypothetical protein
MMDGQLALLRGSTSENQFLCVGGRFSENRDRKRTSPDDIDRCDRTPEGLFNGASQNLEFIIAREDKSGHDEHS